MDDPPRTDGNEYEVDAVEAQAEALGRGDAVTGLGPRAASRVEEIVVQARKRAELLKDTPVAVTVLSDELLRQAGIIQAGSITPDPFDPETIDNFELGVKAIGFGRLLSVNLALLYGDYQDIQVTQFETTVDPDGQITSRRVTQNAASVSTKGVEVEVFTQPFDGLQIAANLGYLDAKYDDFPDAENQLTGEIINRGGQPFRGVSPFESFVSGLPVSAGDGSSVNGWLTPRIEWAYRAGYNASWAETLPRTNRGTTC